jgi:hypothetical protein
MNYKETKLHKDLRNKMADEIDFELLINLEQLYKLEQLEEEKIKKLEQEQLNKIEQNRLHKLNKLELEQEQLDKFIQDNIHKFEQDQLKNIKILNKFNKKLSDINIVLDTVQINMKTINLILNEKIRTPNNDGIFDIWIDLYRRIKNINYNYCLNTQILFLRFINKYKINCNVKNYNNIALYNIITVFLDLILELRPDILLLKQRYGYI